MKRAEKFWNRIARRYASAPIKDQTGYEKRLAISRQYLTPASRVLEIGCGTGSTAIAHAPYVSEILATDISARMVEIAREKLQDTDIGNVRFEQLDADALSSLPGRYDAVLCLNVIHLLDDPQRTLCDLHGLLTEHGILISSTACIGDRQGFLKPLLWLGKVFGALPQVQVFTTDTLRGMVISAQFEILTEWQPDKSPAMFMVARRLPTAQT